MICYIRNRETYMIRLMLTASLYDFSYINSHELKRQSWLCTWIDIMIDSYFESKYLGISNTAHHLYNFALLPANA